MSLSLTVRNLPASLAPEQVQRLVTGVASLKKQDVSVTPVSNQVGSFILTFRSAAEKTAAKEQLSGFTLGQTQLEVAEDTAPSADAEVAQANVESETQLKIVPKPPSDADEQRKSDLDSASTRLTGEQMFKLMSEIKNGAAVNAEETKRVLLQNPPLVYALLQAHLALGTVDMHDMKEMLDAHIRRAAEQPPLLDINAVGPARHDPLQRPLLNDTAGYDYNSRQPEAAARMPVAISSAEEQHGGYRSMSDLDFNSSEVQTILLITEEQIASLPEEQQRVVQMIKNEAARRSDISAQQLSRGYAEVPMRPDFRYPPPNVLPPPANSHYFHDFHNRPPRFPEPMPPYAANDRAFGYAADRQNDPYFQPHDGRHHEPASFDQNFYPPHGMMAQEQHAAPPFSEAFHRPQQFEHDEQFGQRPPFGAAVDRHGNARRRL